MGFRLHLNRGGFLLHSPLSSSTTPSWPSSHSCRGRDNFYLARLSAPSVLCGEAETLSNAYRTHSDSASLQLMEGYFWRTRETKVSLEKGPSDRLCSSLGYGIQMSYNGDGSAYLTDLQATQASHFRLLMKNLDMLEGLCDDSSAVRLERDILEQLERLGAIGLFHSCLSRTLKFSSSFNSSNIPAEAVVEPRINNSVAIHTEKVIVQSGKKDLRRLRRKRTLVKDNVASMQDSCSQTVSEYHRQPSASAKKSSRSRNKKRKITRNEAEMSNGFKAVAELEKIRTLLEEETCQVASLSSWAEAAGITIKELQQKLDYGWHCRDQLLPSARSLVLFIARNYMGLGIAFEDLIQAGNFGVLQGAERFDQSRGYKFSTYVQYWVRKSMSSLVAKHAKGIRVPSTLSKVINQIQRARKALSTRNGKYPDDCEIAKHTGLSMAKIMSTSRCLRVVGSIDQNIGQCISIKYTEVTADTSLPSPEEAVTRQHLIQDVYALLECLKPREKQVLILRFGLGNHQCKSLDEIGRHFCVSKEWIRKIERAALAKLRDEKSLQNLSIYAHLQQ